MAQANSLKAFVVGKEVMFDQASWWLDGMITCYPLQAKQWLLIKHDFKSGVTKLVCDEFGDEVEIEFKRVPTLIH